MAHKIFSNDLPAARAYHADKLVSAGYDADARTIYAAPNVVEIAIDFLHENALYLLAKIKGLHTSAPSHTPTASFNAPKHTSGMRI